MNHKAELLAPAGSFDVMKACIAAGADAVYMGLGKFSARAFADNAGDEIYLQAIDYAHLHGAKLYLTINTLFKENELFSELFDTLKPLYEAGLDAVIVQDIGAMRFVHECFPDLPIHASTQATVTGPEAVKFLQNIGVRRTVPARELSLKELRNIKEMTGTELECFIHGALCYCYSGQCLFSSIVGGRSGNRGRCAQPCRMAYSVKDGERYVSRKNEGYVLSLKDLNTLQFLPALLESGIYSLKIEGRMKKAEYAAGVTSIYRKYLDLYFEKGENGYRVDPEDESRLYSLFNRKGFTEGYYKKHNGRDMLTLTAPDFREEDTAFTKEIRENFIEKEHRIKLNGTYQITKDRPMSLTLTCLLDGKEFRTAVHSVCIPAPAEKRSATKEEVEKQLLKTGDSGFVFEKLDGLLEEGLFLPVKELNELRRHSIEKLQEVIVSNYRRNPESAYRKDFGEEADVLHSEGMDNSFPAFGLSALVRTKNQLRAVLSQKNIREICLESTIIPAEEYAMLVNKIKKTGKLAYLAFPRIFRDRAAFYFNKNKEALKNADFDGFVIRSLEESGWLQQAGIPGKMIADYALYAFNSLAEREYLTRGFDRLTMPVELNGKELLSTGFQGAEILIYGRLPMMISANCIHRTTEGCDQKEKELLLIDRMGNALPVLNECRYCLNTIFNALPLSLLDVKKEVCALKPACGRLEFTTETEEETKKVLQAFDSVYMNNQTASLEFPFTRGHFRRGVD